MMRWERHWWQKTEQITVVPREEPTVWVDPELYIEQPRTRMASGTVPPPSCEGAHCTLEQRRAITMDDSMNPFGE